MLLSVAVRLSLLFGHIISERKVIETSNLKEIFHLVRVTDVSVFRQSSRSHSFTV